MCYFCFRCCVVFDCDVSQSLSSLGPKDSEVCEKLIGYEYDSSEACGLTKYKIKCCLKSD